MVTFDDEVRQRSAIDTSFVPKIYCKIDSTTETTHLDVAVLPRKDPVTPEPLFAVRDGVDGHKLYVAFCM